MGQLVRSLLDPVMLEQIQPRGKTLLDIGCGEGYFTRVLKMAGAARVVGTDISPELIKKALEQDPGGEYQVCDIGAGLPGAPGSFDAVSACMVLMDLPDLESAYRSISACLIPSGKFVACMINPYYSNPVGEWRKTLRSGLHRQLEPKRGTLRRIVRQLGEVARGDYERILCIGNYFENRVVTKMLGDTATLHFHKPFSDYVNLAINHDLVLERLLEPQISPELYERNANELLAKALVTVPLFFVLVFRKSR
jgi:SAM-dependent methyltransferase